MPEWPFLKLVVTEDDDRQEILPEEDLEEILEIYFGMRERPKKPEKAFAVVIAAGAPVVVLAAAVPAVVVRATNLCKNNCFYHRSCTSDNG